MAKVINDSNFSEETNEGLVLVDFYADWCGPCKMLAPILEEVAKKNEKVKIVKVDTEASPELASKFSITSIPALLLFKDGVVVDQTVGFMAAPVLEAFIAKHE